MLDVGCGHGLMLIGAAKRLSSGRAIGIDIWQDVDQANNSAAATRRNAELEGVSVAVRDGDARRIPSTARYSMSSSPAWRCTTSTMRGSGSRRWVRLPAS